jgi:hypothetical protein
MDLQHLKTALPRFPQETNFEWIGMRLLRTDPALDPVFNELESLAREHAMSSCVRITIHCFPGVRSPFLDRHTAHLLNLLDSALNLLICSC